MIFTENRKGNWTILSNEYIIIVLRIKIKQNVIPNFQPFRNITKTKILSVESILDFLCIVNGDVSDFYMVMHLYFCGLCIST